MSLSPSENGGCKHCHGRKFVSKNNKWIRCKCLQKSKKIEAYDNARIPTIFHGYTWRKAKSRFAEQIEAIERAKHTADRLKLRKRSRSIILKGDNTEVLAIANLILKEVVDAGRTAFMVSTAELLEAEFDKGPDSMRATIEPAYYCEILYLRLAVEPRNSQRSKEYAAHALEKLCLYRRTNKLFTFYSSKLGWSAIEREYGKLLPDLLHETPIAIRI